MKKVRTLETQVLEINNSLFFLQSKNLMIKFDVNLFSFKARICYIKIWRYQFGVRKLQVELSFLCFVFEVFVKTPFEGRFETLSMFIYFVFRGDLTFFFFQFKSK